MISQVWAVLYVIILCIIVSTTKVELVSKSIHNIKNIVYIWKRLHESKWLDQL